MKRMKDSTHTFTLRALRHTTFILWKRRLPRWTRSSWDGPWRLAEALSLLGLGHDVSLKPSLGCIMFVFHPLSRCCFLLVRLLHDHQTYFRRGALLDYNCRGWWSHTRFPICAGRLTILSLTHVTRSLLSSIPTNCSQPGQGFIQ